MAPKKESIKKISISTEVATSEDANAEIGKFYYPNGATYEGEWILAEESTGGEPPPPPGPLNVPLSQRAPIPPKDRIRPNRQRHGKGLYIEEGYQYDGEWKNDKMHGHGCFKYKSGASYDGQWVDSIYSGIGTYRWPNGAKYMGGWLENKMHGDGTFIDKEDNTWTGQFFNGTGPGLVMEIK